MKTVHLVIIGLLCSVGISAQEFKFEKEMIDYGKIEQNANGERTFVFTNIGKEPLMIKTVTSSCGCTVPKKPEKPIMPGEKGEIKVSYDTKRLGGFYKQITIFSNAKNPRKVIKIRGYINKPGQVNLEKKKTLLNN